MDGRTRVPVLSKLSLAPDKGWNIGVTETTTVHEIINIVSRALKFDPSTAAMFATIPGSQTQMNPTDCVLPTYQEWQRNGIQGRFIIRDKPQEKQGVDLFQLIHSQRPVPSYGEPVRPRGINTSNTFTGGSNVLSTNSYTPQFQRSGQSATPNLIRGRSDPHKIQSQTEKSAKQHLQLIQERKRDLLEKKEKLNNLLADYSKKLAAPLDPSAMNRYRENISKANMGLSTIEEKLRALEDEEKIIDRRRSTTTNIPVIRNSSSQVLDLPQNTRFQAEQEVEKQILFPEQMRAQLAADSKRIPFDNLLSLVQKTSVPDIQEKALRLVGNLCQIQENQGLLLRTRLLPILLYLMDSSSSSSEVVKLSCWLVACLSSPEANKILIENADGIPVLVRLLKSSNDIAEHAAAAITNILNSRNKELHNAFRSAQGLQVGEEILRSGMTTVTQKVNILRFIILLGLSSEDKQLLASKYTITAIMKMLSEGDTPKKLAIMILSAVSSVEASRPAIRAAKEFSLLLAVLKGNDLRLIEKTVLIINNLALTENNLDEAFQFIIPLIDHSDLKVQTKAIQCLSNLVLIDEEHLEVFYEYPQSLDKITALLQSQQEPVLASVLRVLVNITHGSGLTNGIREELGQAQVIQHLAALLCNITNQEIQEQTLKAMVNISLSYSNEKDYLDTKIVSLLAKFLTPPYSQRTEFALANLVNITRRSDKIRAQVRHVNSLGSIVSLCESVLPTVQSYACKAITNLALNGRNRYYFQQCNSFIGYVERLSTTSGVEDVVEAASQAVRNLKFPCEDYSATVDDVDERQSQDMKEMIKKAELQVEEEQNEESAPLTKDEALKRIRTLSSAPSEEDIFDNLLSEITAENPQSSSPSPTKSKVKNETPPDLNLELGALGDMEQMVDSGPTPRTMAKLLREENERLIAEQRKMLEDERKKFEEERKKFEQERLQLSQNQSKLVKDEKAVEEKTEKVSKEEEVLDPAKEEKYHNRRTKIAVEILVTERSYVDSLNTMVNKYMNPMYGLTLGRKPVVKHTQVNEIFANVEEIINYHTMLLEGLERRVSKFDGSTCLGEFFISMTDYLRCYTTYVNNYNNAIEVLTELEENSEFEAKLKSLTDGGMKGKSIYTYLIMPIQRIPRYILLLNELIKHTRPTHPDFPHLKEAVDQMEQLADYIDESKEAYNENQFVVGLQKRIKGFPKEQTLVAPNRILVKNAPLIMNQSDYWVFLFTDILMQTLPIDTPAKKKKKKDEKEWPHYQFVRLISLKGVELFDYPDSKIAPNAFSLRGKDYSFNCSTESKEEKIYWICALKQTIVKT